MDQGHDLRTMRPIFVSLFISLALAMGCKDRGEGPKSPESNPIMNEGLPQPVSGDASGQKTEQPDIPGAKAPGTETGSNVLPEKFMTGLGECQKQGRYFDLQVASCTETPLAEFPCDLTVLLSEGSAVLNAGQKQLLKDYVEKNLQGFSLYACTVEDSKPALHFYKVEADKIRAHNVKIASP
ncbi:MAG TPA: hypothetical protein VFO10_19150 [Oligoflexus sp.]|uniref:hypothetical protein n=1 Tax=Oligoflexus sp. TaxID=1971216 RepID=UPI002D80E0DF|nr:hypothetical protein [Oligoflexus sp.]HET9239387.1 hypothetical protein [Oligoflexus sp.]